MMIVRQARTAAICVAAPALALMLAASAARAEQPQSPAPMNIIHVDVIGLRSSAGKVGCALFASPAGFPRDSKQALKRMRVAIDGGHARCDFAGVSAGTYAVTTYHDENDNHKFDSTWLGIPKEGYGFSGNVHPKLHAPSFDDTRFKYPGGEMTLEIKMIYW
jgi:uncharacterized protein (DUF2141 family)